MAGELAGEEGRGRKEGSELGAPKGSPRPREKRRPHYAKSWRKRARGPTRGSRGLPSPTFPETRLQAPGRLVAARRAAAGEARGPRGRGRERTGLLGPARLAELPAPRADCKSRPRGSGRGLIRILFAMQQLGGGLSLADFQQQQQLRVLSLRREGRGAPRTQ